MKFHKELERRHVPHPKARAGKRWLDLHVSLTIAVRDVNNEAAFKKEVERKISSLFHGRGDVIVHEVGIGDLHDPKAI